MRVRDPRTLAALLQPDVRLPADVARALLEDVADTGALLEGHFVLQGGAHSTHFLRFAHLGRSPSTLDRVSGALLGLLGALPPGTQVLCPESSGFLLGHAMARNLGAPPVVSAIDARRRPAPRLRAGELRPGEPVLVLNDVSTTGASLEPLLALAESARCPVVAVGVFAALEQKHFRRWLVGRGIRGEALLAGGWDTWAAGPDCPGCAAGRPLLPASELN